MHGIAVLLRASNNNVIAFGQVFALDLVVFL